MARKLGENKCDSASWDSLPRDILEMVFGNLVLGDRIRVGAVCKYWNCVVRDAKHIPRIPEAPWQILSEDSYDSPQPFITQVSFKSLSESKIYPFKLPDDHNQGWLCGSSRGWLLVASGDKLDPDLFLWNPLSGSIQNLPSLSTHPYYEGFLESVQERATGNFSCLFHRLQVFESDDGTWVVAAILNYQFDDYTNQLSFCTPGDERWTMYGEEEDESFYIDIMFHGKENSLFVLTFGDSPKKLEDSASREVFHLSGRCTVQLSFIFFDDEDRNRGQNWTTSQNGFATLKCAKQVLRLVEGDYGGGDVIVVATDLDSRCGRSKVIPGAIIAHYWTGHVSLVPFSTSSSKTVIGRSGVGNQTMFLGSTSTSSMMVSGPLEGIDANCVYLAIDDSFGLCSDDGRYSIREYGIYSLESKQMRRRDDHTNVRCPPPTKIGWFQPKF